MRNKILISILLTSLASSALALPRDTINHPNLFEVELTAGAFQIDTGDSDYGYLEPSLLTLEVLKTDPKYKFGGTALLRYYFDNSPLNVDVSYTGARAHSNDSAYGTIESDFVLIYDYSANTKAESSYHFNYDFANVEIGSLTQINHNSLIINPQLGISYARLKGYQTSHFTQPSVVGDLFENSKFSGVGPSIGLTMNFVLDRVITLSGNFRYSALIGNIESNMTSESTESIYLESHNKNEVVSLIQSELALGINLDMFGLPCANVAVGYQITKAFDAVDRFGFTITDAFYNKSIHGGFVRLTKIF